MQMLRRYGWLGPALIVLVFALSFLVWVQLQPKATPCSADPALASAVRQQCAVFESMAADRTP
jgi:hypothetical protein